jgi:nucleoside-diphosphate-sugar epimerase
MVIGKGLIGREFQSYSQNSSMLIFASGVSDSQATCPDAFIREEVMLRNALITHASASVSYFSTCSVNDPSSLKSPYVRHKLAMEDIVKTQSRKFWIFRLPQVVGHATSPTLINFLFQRAQDGAPFEVWKNSCRNLIDVSDVFRTVKYLHFNDLLYGSVINIAALNNTPILEITALVEQITRSRLNYKLVNKGCSYEIDVSQVHIHYPSIGVNFNGDYNHNILNKYYTDPSIKPGNSTML